MCLNIFLSSYTIFSKNKKKTTNAYMLLLRPLLNQNHWTTCFVTVSIYLNRYFFQNKSLLVIQKWNSQRIISFLFCEIERKLKQI